MSESTMTITEYGTKFWTNMSDELHRLDGPAIERKNGSKEWFQNGKRHRLDGPAVDHANGTKHWWQNDLRHRIDGPAVEYDDGSNRWYYKNDFLGENLEGFWKLWDRLNDKDRQNLKLHMWFIKLCSV